MSLKKRTVLPEDSTNWVLNCDYSRPDILLYKKNVRAVLLYCGVSFRSFWEIAKRNGVTVSREGFFRIEMLRFPSYLWLGTFSRLIGVPVYRLLDPNLPELLEAGVVKPSILGIHRAE